MSVQRVGTIGTLLLGEGPHWDSKTKCLYFVDILGNTLHKYSPSDDTHYKVSVTKTPSLIIPVRNEPNKFIISQERNVVLIEWINDQANVAKTLLTVDEAETTQTNRINDGKCDASGCLWFGTMGKLSLDGNIDMNKGSLFCSRKSTPLFEQVTCSNGLAWSEDNKKFYYIDSWNGTIDEFDFDINTSSICNRRAIFTLKKHNIPGLPDGMTIDIDGNLWVAIYGGSRVIKINPREPETLLETLMLPTKCITSVTFGGENLDEMYVTTAKDKTEGAEHGAVYKVIGLGVRGFAGVEAIPF